MKNPLRILLSVALLALGAFASLSASAAEEALCNVCRVHDGETELEEVVASSDYLGTTYGFCSNDCRDRFDEAPAYYVPPAFPRPAPPFAVRDLEGRELSSEELAGRPVLLDFWATWCPPCIQDLPKLTRLHERYGASGLAVLSVSIDEGDDAVKKIHRMIKKRKATHPVYLDGLDAPAWSAFLVRVVPTQFLIDAEGQVVAQWSGKIDWEQVESEIVRLLEPEASAAPSP